MGTLKNNTTASQLAAIRKHLRRYRKIDVRTAREQYGCERLGARIWQLRHDPLDPMEIVTDYAEGTNRYGHHVRYAVYRLRRATK